MKALTLRRGMVALVSWCAIGATAATWRVDAAHPRASDRGPGDEAHPLASLGEAMRRLQPGDTVRIAPGLYREALLLPARRWAGAPATLIEGVAGRDGGVPELRGSVVATGWQAEDGTPGLFSRAWPQQAQQVFVDGRPLQQVGGTIFGGLPASARHPLAGLHAKQGGIWPGRLAPRAPQALPPNSFQFDAAGGRLWVQCDCRNLDARQVEVSVLPVLIAGHDLDNVTVRRLAVRHANGSTNDRSAAVSLGGRALTLSELNVQQVDAIGIGVRGQDIVVERSTVGFAGQLGLAAKGRRIRIADNHLHDNNTRGFNKWWEAGGAKFVGDGPHDSEVVGNLVERNRGDGLWFDYGPSNNLLRGNVVIDNTGFGIHYEASFTGRIEGNLVARNGQRGIYLPQSSGSVVAGNLVVGNGLEGISVVDEGRRDPKNTIDLENKANVVCGNLVAWNKGGGIVLPGKLLDNRSDDNTLVGRGPEVQFGYGHWPNVVRPNNLELPQWRGLSRQDERTAVLARSADRAAIGALAGRAGGVDLAGVARALGLPADALKSECAR